MGRYDTLLQEPAKQQPPVEVPRSHVSDSQVISTQSQAAEGLQTQGKNEGLHANMQACIHACMQAIMQELPDLQNPGVQSLSVRVTHEDFRWLRKITNAYNEELEKKFSQGLFVRIGLKLLKQMMTYDPQAVKDFLKEI